MRSFKARLIHIITKNGILTIDQEAIMLSFDHCSLKIHERLNNKFIYCACACFSFKLVDRCVRWMIVTLPFMLMLLESFYDIYHHH
jgi:hypothetical protein